jgi:RNase P subunit RPR2
MTCQKCGTKMNHQADKLREPTTREEAESTRLGGVVIAVFACPNCGWIASTPRSED